MTQTYFEGDVLDDIQRIRELNNTDIILAPRGKILDKFKDLIIDFRLEAGADAPVGDVTLTLSPRR